MKMIVNPLSPCRRPPISGCIGGWIWHVNCLAVSVKVLCLCLALAIVLATAADALGQPGLIQVGPQRGTGRAGVPVEGAVLTSDREMAKKLADARKLLEEGRFGEAIRNLDSILEAPEDSFFQPDKKSPVHRSLKAEAQRLLGELPPEGRELYELQYGARASKMLDEALAGQRPGAIGRGIQAVLSHSRRLPGDVSSGTAPSQPRSTVGRRVGVAAPAARPGSWPKSSSRPCRSRWQPAGCGQALRTRPGSCWSICASATRRAA